MAVGCSYILLSSLGIIAQQGRYGRVDYISLLVQYWGNVKRVFSSFPGASSRGLSGTQYLNTMRVFIVGIYRQTCSLQCQNRSGCLHYRSPARLVAASNLPPHCNCHHPVLLQAPTQGPVDLPAPRATIQWILIMASQCRTTISKYTMIIQMFHINQPGKLTMYIIIYLVMHAVVPVMAYNLSLGHCCPTIGIQRYTLVNIYQCQILRTPTSLGCVYQLISLFGLHDCRYYRYWLI